jgi:hypothetical protein
LHGNDIVESQGIASLQERNGSDRVLFSYHGKLHGFILGQIAPDEAERKSRQADYLLMRLKQGLLFCLPASIS